MKLIVARHNEDLSWLDPSWDVTIYNDGGYIENSIKGDGVPCETTKYVKYILDNWENSTDDILVFTQADPFIHNPTFIKVLESSAEWNSQFQPLSLIPHPSVPIVKDIEAQTIPNLVKFKNGGMVWSDKNMDDNFQGEFWKDPFADELRTRTHMTMTKMCELLGISPKLNVEKTYSAIFATNWKKIKEHDKSVWQKVNDYVVHAPSQKDAACVIEYMWSVLLS
jgi:hypothetical protein